MSLPQSRGPIEGGGTILFQIEQRRDVVPDLERPGWVAAGAAPYDGFDELASYAGAFPPATGAPWTANWTSFPRD